MSKVSVPVQIYNRKILRNIARANMKKAKIPDLNDLNPNFEKGEVTPFQRNWRDFIVDGKHLKRGSTKICTWKTPKVAKTPEA